MADWIVMSVKFGLRAKASDFSTETHQRIARSEYLKTFNLHDPNAFNKLFCGKLPNGEPDWERAADISFPCRGTKQTCKLQISAKRALKPSVKNRWKQIHSTVNALFPFRL